MGVPYPLSPKKIVSGSVSKSLRASFFQLTALNILSNITIPITGLVDTGMLGNFVGSLAIAGFALGNVLFDYLYWGCSFLRMGTTGTTAIRTGQGDEEGAYLVLFRSLFIGLILGLIIYLLSGLIAELIFPLLSGSKEVKELGRLYFHSRVWDAPFTMMNFVLIGWFLGRARSDIVLFLTVVCNLSNILMDYILIKYFSMGVDGVGYATGIAQVVQFILSTGIVIYFWFCYQKNIPKGILYGMQKKILKVSEFLFLLNFNKDIFLRSVFLILAFSLFRNFSAYIGDEYLAANAILLQFLLVFAFFIDGAAFATETLAGNLYGSRNQQGLEFLIRQGIIFGFYVSFIFIAIIYFFQNNILAILTTNPSTIHLAKNYLLGFFLVLIPGSIAFIYDGLFLGIIQGRVLRNAMFIASILVFFPTSLIGIYYQSNWILWLALSNFMITRAVVLHYAWKTWQIP